MKPKCQCFKVKGEPSSALPYIHAQAGAFHFSALVDSGSGRCIISGDVFRKLVGDRCVKQIAPVSWTCRTATDEPMAITHELTLHLKIDAYSWDVTFLVAPGLHTDMIIGADFIRQNAMVIDLSKGGVYFNFQAKPPEHTGSQCSSKPTHRLVPITGFRKFFANNITEPHPEDSSEQQATCTDNSPVTWEQADLSHLTPEQRTKAQDILRKHPTVCTSELGCTNALSYGIELNDPTPVKSSPYTLLQPKMEILRKHVEELEKKGVVCPSKSPYASPAFLVPKGPHDWRMVIDYRKINQKVVTEAVPLPDINTAFSWFGSAKFFCVLDMNQAYHQIPLTKASQPITAFCTPWGLYEYTRVPFGLATGAQVLTRLGNLLFQDLRFKNLVNFLDDFVLYADTFEELMDVLGEVLSRFAKAGITINPKKMQIGVQRIRYLGHIISYRGIEIDPERTAAIREYQPPRDAKGIARFIGMINYYSRFIPHLAEKAAPLNQLRRKNVKFVWTDVHQNAFEELKTCLISPPILRTPDWTREMILQTDWSSVAVGAVLLQEVDGVGMPIAFASRVLTECERKYDAYEGECLAVLFGCDKFRPYLEHREFLLECDNQALSWLLSHPRQLGRIARWVVRISSLKFRVQHIKGTLNVFADALSRMYDTNEEPTAPETESIRVNAVKIVWPQFPIAHMDIKTFQEADSDLKPKLDALREGKHLSRYLLVQDVLCSKTARDKQAKIVLPKALTNMVFNYYHQSPLGGHLGTFKTLAKIRNHFTYLNMNEDVHLKVKNCIECAKAKPATANNFGELVSDLPQYPMEKIFVDYMGPMVRSKDGNVYILVCVDSFSKYVWLLPTRNSTAPVTVKALTSIFQSFGFPKFLASDNGPQFRSHLLHDFCFNFGIKPVKTSPHHPQGNLSERINRTLKSALIGYHSNSQTSWDKNLPWLQLAFNSAVHETHHTTPFSLMFSYQPAHPLSLMWSFEELLPSEKQDPTRIAAKWNEVKRALRRAHDKSAAKYNPTRQPIPFKVGDLVLVKNFPQSKKINKRMAKLEERWTGPWKIEKFVSPVTVSLVNPDNNDFLKIAHVTHLKVFHGDHSISN